MKTTYLKFLAVLLSAALTLEANAQPGQRTPGGSARAESKTYVQQNVLPVLRQQRQKLEAQLSTADRTQLASYRAQLQELRQRSQTLRQSLTPPAAGAPSPALTTAQQQQRQELRTATKAVLSSVAQLARKYDATITKLAQEVQPQRNQWATDLAAIRARHATPGQDPTANGRRHAGPASHLFRPTRFLLLDPAAPTQAAPSARASLYPNPAVASSQLTYEVQKTGPVTIDLLDGRGNTLRTVAQESRQEKGPHTVQIDLSGLPSGVYFYKISTRTGVETQRFVKE